MKKIAKKVSIPSCRMYAAAGMALTEVSIASDLKPGRPVREVVVLMHTNHFLGGGHRHSD